MRDGTNPPQPLMPSGIELDSGYQNRSHGIPVPTREGLAAFTMLTTLVDDSLEQVVGNSATEAPLKRIR
jgi:hypothetical protein